MARLEEALYFAWTESYELSKGALLLRGGDLYHPTWNDQPPFYTWLLATAFKFFGESALVGRWLTLLFVGLGLSAYTYIIGGRERTWGTSCLAVLFLTSSPFFVKVSVLTMIDLPSMLLAVMSLALVMLRPRRGKVLWLAASGILYGLAVQTKLTALLYGPALVVDLLLDGRPGHSVIWRGSQVSGDLGRKRSGSGSACFLSLSQ